MNNDKVLVTDMRHADIEVEKKTLEPFGIKVDNTFCQTEEDLIKNGKGAMGFLVSFANISKRVMENLPDLKVIVKYGVGYDNIDVKAATQLGKYVANVRGHCREEVALQALSLLLNGVRKTCYFISSVKAGIWEQDPSKYSIQRLSNMNVGIIGFGEIARTFAFYIERMCAKIFVFDPYFNRSDQYNKNKYIFSNSIDDLYSRSDAVSINCPLNSETQNMISKKILSTSSKKIIINTSRGGIVNHKDMLDALNSDEVAFYATDAFISEPANYEDQIQKAIINHNKVIVTPHYGWYSQSSEKDLRKMAAENIVDVLQDRLPKFVINS